MNLCFFSSLHKYQEHKHESVDTNNSMQILQSMLLCYSEVFVNSEYFKHFFYIPGKSTLFPWREKVIFIR